MTAQAQAKTVDLVQYAVRLVAQGTPQDCQNLARQKEFIELANNFGPEVLVMDFPYAERHKLYAYVNHHILRNVPVDYLEFGVARGNSMRDWLRINSHAESRFFGFDSFEGLPENWRPGAPKGRHSTDGEIPKLDDPRVTFIKGLFQHTVDRFSMDFKPRNKLVLHLDADLYSSTLYVLMALDRHITPGTVLLFDEFNARCYTDEFAALQDYCRACLKQYKFLAVRKGFSKLAVQIV